jgi:uncharacterized protein (TIGR02145 family)
MKTNYLTLFFTIASFVIILILFYNVIIDVFYKSSSIKAGNKIDEIIIGDQVWKSTNLDLDTFRDGDLIPKVESDEEWVKAGSTNPSPIPTPVENKMTDIDGNQYDVIKIGNQIWMKENLKVSKYRNGEAIPTGLVNTVWANTNKGAYAIYNNDNTNNVRYGKLYNWYAVNDSRGLCPSGWHIPSESDWSTLLSYLGGDLACGGKLKSIGTSYWYSPNSDATNVSGFSALPGGSRDNDGSFDVIRNYAFFWSATEYGNNDAFTRNLDYYSNDFGRSYGNKRNGFSVRCVRD